MLAPRWAHKSYQAVPSSDPYWPHKSAQLGPRLDPVFTPDMPMWAPAGELNWAPDKRLDGAQLGPLWTCLTGYSHITLYINSSEGAFTTVLAIYDTISQIHADVSTVCIGNASATAALLLSSGTKGKRYALPNARITISQVSLSAEGKATDIEVAAKEVMYLKKSINKILVANTLQSIEKIQLDTERDLVMNAEEAKAYGLIDSIIQKVP